MDKNTLYAVLLMGLVFFGFMYINRPSQEEIEKARQEQQQQAAADAPAAQAPEFTGADSTALCAAVRAMGTATDSLTRTFHNDNFDLTLSGNTLSGTATADSATIDINALLANRSTLTTAQNTRLLKDLRTLCANALRYEGFAPYLGGVAKTAVLENSRIALTLTSRGGQIAQAVLKDYKTETTTPETPIHLFRADTDGYGFIFNTADQRMDTREFNFELVQESDSTVLMALRPAPGTMWGIRYTLPADSYVVHMDLVQQGMAGVLPASTSSMVFDWNQKLGRNELGRTFEQQKSGLYYKLLGESPDDLSSSKDDDESVTGAVKWVAFKNQFFSSVIIARQNFTAADMNSVFLKDDPDYLKEFHLSAHMPYGTADGTTGGFYMYLGPNDYPLLNSLDDTLEAGDDLQLTRLIPLGWGLFRWFNTLIVIPIFDFLGRFISNYGIIILLLTIIIKILLFPFTYKSYTSQAKMRLLAPEVQKINEKYPGDQNALKRQQETMALYSRAGASPMSGCLPMLLQMPVFIALFNFFPSAIELRGQSFLWAHDLSAPDFICTLPFSIPFYGNHVSLFCLLMTIVNVIYMQITMSSQSAATGSMASMKWMNYLMPIMFLCFFNDYAAGLSYFYFLSLLITILQTWVVRKFVSEDKMRAKMAENAKKPRKKSGFMARLEEAQRQQQAALRQQQNRKK